MIAGTALETELATQVRVVNDETDPVGTKQTGTADVEVKNTTLDVDVKNTANVEIKNTSAIGVEVDNPTSKPLPVDLRSSLQVTVVEDLSPYFYWRNFPTITGGDDHYWAVGRWDADDNDSHHFIWKDLIVRSENNDEDLDKWELVAFTDGPTTSAGYERERFRDRSGVQPTGNSRPAIWHKYDSQQPGAVGAILGPLRNLGAVLTKVTHPTDSITHVDMSKYWFSSGYRSTNVWGTGIRRLKDRTPDITIAIGGLWLPKAQG